MVLSWIFTVLLAISCICAPLTGRGSELATSVLTGAQAGITLGISIGGSLCLWTAFGALMERIGLTDALSRLLRPLLTRIFPSSQQNPKLAGIIGANICANLLGLGNAATPMGIRAVRELAGGRSEASDEMCRLVVLNTASIQLIPTNVAAIRASLACAAPFDLLPMVWITSLCSASAGLLAARGLERIWRHG